ncbi:MAG TPA: hypothetical protein VIM19_11925 [Actinomycetes bacterium]
MASRRPADRGRRRGYLRQLRAGEHLWGRTVGDPAPASVPVVGPELGLADALATAAFVAPRPVPSCWQLRWTPGLDGVLTSV